MEKYNIIFDLDGTLWNSEEQVLKVWNNAFIKYDKKVNKKQLEACFGKTAEEIASIIFPEIPKEESIRRIDEANMNELSTLRMEGAKLYPHLKDVLLELSKDFNLFIVSNCQKGYIETFLEHYDFGEFFLDFECYGNTHETKDKNISKVIERNNLSKQNTIYVGDTYKDYEAACNAGIEFVLASYGFGKVKEAKYKISSLKDLEKTAYKVLISPIL